MSSPQIIDSPEIVKDFLAWKNLSASNHLYLGIIQGCFHPQKCFNRKSSLSRKWSKTFLPGKILRPKIIYISELFKKIFTYKALLAQYANHQYPANIQSLFHLRNCVGPKSSKCFANHQYLGNIQGPLCLQNCRSHKSSLSWENSKTFAPGLLYEPQIFNMPESFKDFSDCDVVLAEEHLYTINFRSFFACKNL